MRAVVPADRDYQRHAPARAETTLFNGCVRCDDVLLAAALVNAMHSSIELTPAIICPRLNCTTPTTPTTLSTTSRTNSQRRSRRRAVGGLRLLRLSPLTTARSDRFETRWERRINAVTAAAPPGAESGASPLSTGRGIVRPVRRPLVLTGGPASGKSTTARLLAEARPRSAFVDVDDVRHFIVSGHVTPWGGVEGRVQQRLGVENACSLVGRLRANEIEVVVADVLTPETSLLYRSLLPDLLVVHFILTVEEARSRAATRPLYITDEEFGMLHDADARLPPLSDHRVSVGGLTVAEQVAVVERLWARPSSGA